MNYGLNDNEISMIFKGVAEFKNVKFDPKEIERVDTYTLDELQTLLEQKPDFFSYWFEQIFLWLIQKPSALQSMSSE